MPAYIYWYIVILILTVHLGPLFIDVGLPVEEMRALIGIIMMDIPIMLLIARQRKTKNTWQIIIGSSLMSLLSARFFAPYIGGYMDYDEWGVLLTITIMGGTILYLLNSGDKG